MIKRLEAFLICLRNHRVAVQNQAFSLTCITLRYSNGWVGLKGAVFFTSAGMATIEAGTGIFTRFNHTSSHFCQIYHIGEQDTVKLTVQGHHQVPTGSEEAPIGSNGG